MKKWLISLGGVVTVIAPFATVVACSNDSGGTTRPADGVFDLTNLSADKAHDYWRGDGLIRVGDKLSLTISGNKYLTTWTQSMQDDEDAATTQQGLFNIVINAFSASNSSLTRDQIIAALGPIVSGDGHHEAPIT